MLSQYLNNPDIKFITDKNGKKMVALPLEKYELLIQKLNEYQDEQNLISKPGLKSEKSKSERIREIEELFKLSGKFAAKPDDTMDIHQMRSDLYNDIYLKY